MNGWLTIFDKTRLIAVLILALCSSLISGACLAEPRVRWDRSTLHVELGAKEQVTYRWTFVPTADLEAASVRIVPALAPYVTVSPTAFANLKKDVTYSVEVTFAVPADIALGVYDGTVSLRQGSKTLAQPLSIQMKVIWPSVTNAQYGVSLSYPDFGASLIGSISPTPEGLLQFESAPPPPDDMSVPPPAYAALFIPNTSYESLRAWFTRAVDSTGMLIGAKTFVRTVLANGVEAYVLRGPVPTFYMGDRIPGVIYAISPSKSTIIVVSLASGNGLSSVAGSLDAVVGNLLLMLGTLVMP